MRCLNLFSTLRVCCDKQQNYRYILLFLILREGHVKSKYSFSEKKLTKKKSFKR